MPMLLSMQQTPSTGASPRLNEVVPLLWLCGGTKSVIGTWYNGNNSCNRFFRPRARFLFPRHPKTLIATQRDLEDFCVQQHPLETERWLPLTTPTFKTRLLNNQGGTERAGQCHTETPIFGVGTSFVCEQASIVFENRAMGGVPSLRLFRSCRSMPLPPPLGECLRQPMQRNARLPTVPSFGHHPHPLPPPHLDRVISVTSPPPPVPPPSIIAVVADLRHGRSAVLPGRGAGLQAALCGKRGRRALRTSEGLSDEVCRCWCCVVWGGRRGLWGEEWSFLAGLLALGVTKLDEVLRRCMPTIESLPA